jgi:hypothetical protein
MQTELAFLKAIFSTFFRWWWAVLTGLASVLSWLAAPQGLTLTRLQFAATTLMVLIVAFFAASTIYQAWRVFRNKIAPSTITDMQRSDSYGGEYVFVISGLHSQMKGRVAELRRRLNGVEVPFAVIEFLDENAKGNFQANPLWISPNHLRELRAGKFVLSEVIVDPFISSRTLQIARIGNPD